MRRRLRLQRALAVAQVTVSVILLAGAGLVTRSMLRLSEVDTGLDGESALTMEVPLFGGASLGADKRRVQRMVLFEGGVLLAAGLVLGVSGALLATRLIRGLLFGVAPHDPATLAVVSVVMLVVGVGACWLPALRAASIDPAVAMRGR